MPDELTVDLSRSDNPVIQQVLSPEAAAEIADAQAEHRQFLAQEQAEQQASRAPLHAFMSASNPSLPEVVAALKAIIQQLQLDRG